MKTRVVHFLILVAMLLVALVAFVVAAGNSGLQLVIGIVTAIAYVVWGIMHHVLVGDLHKKVVVEYVLIAAIAMLLLQVALGP